GHVVSVTSRELIFQSDGFLDEFAIPLDDVVEVKSLNARTTRNQSDVYAFADGSVVIQAKGDGETPKPVSLELDEATRSKAVAKMTLPEVPRMVHSVAYSAHRLRLQSGWQYTERGDLSASSQPSMRDGTMAVFNCELPNRFCLLLRARCNGTADFEVTLGDLIEASAGRNDRRGSSLSRSPVEKNRTSLQWFDSSVTAVRSNNGLADATSVPNSTRAIELVAFVDQSSGRLILVRDQRQIGEVMVDNDGEVASRTRLTLIQRGAPITVEDLVVYHWSGNDPRAFPKLLTETNRAKSPVAVELADGTKLCGESFGEPLANNMLSLQSSVANWRIPVEEIAALRFTGRTSTKSPGESQCDTYTNELHEHVGGHLVAVKQDASGESIRAGQGGGLAIVPEFSEQPLRINLREPFRISRERTASQPPASQPQHSGTLDSDTLILLRSGETLSVSGSVNFIDDMLSFECERVSAASLHSQALDRLELNAPSAPTPKTLIELSRVRSEREGSAPPNAWLASRDGDILVCNLIALDREFATVQVRTRKRRIPISRLATIGWIALKDPIESAAEDPTTTITLADHTQLRLANIRSKGETLVGDHALLRECEFRLDEVIRLQAR
ncbi:MAG: hypothetical protein AAF802_29670, partial [Planctomycetota bacterium]